MNYKEENIMKESIIAKIRNGKKITKQERAIYRGFLDITLGSKGTMKNMIDKVISTPGYGDVISPEIMNAFIDLHKFMTRELAPVSLIKIKKEKTI